MHISRVCILATLLSAAAPAQDAFLDRWNELAARMPNGAKLALTLPKNGLLPRRSDHSPVELHVRATRCLCGRYEIIRPGGAYEL